MVEVRAFIGNRVSKIQKNSDPACWRYVPSKENPADIATHGKSIDDLRKNTLWWYGPEFLIDQNKWPEAVVFVNSQLELRNNHSTYLQIKEQDNMERLNPTRYSSWKKLTRILAWINRFYQNCKQNDRTHRKIGELQPHEVINAEFHFIKKAQQEEFKEEYDVVMKQKCVSVKSSLSCLMPFMDEDGIIRANTRIREADYIPYNVKHPIILPRHHQVSKLIVRQQHLDNNHYGGTNHILSQLSSKYWIISAREVIKEVEGACYECRRRKKVTAKQVMAPLPKSRLYIPLKAFVQCAVDYGGPFITIQGRGKRRAKRYLCLFTCFHSRVQFI